MLITAVNKKIVYHKKSLPVFILSLCFTSNVFAAAGDLISNTVFITYDVSGLPGTVNATTSFTEDRRINFLVTESNGGAVVPVISDMTAAVLQFTVTNMGNDTHDFLVTAVNTAPNPFGLPADSFDPLPGSIQVFVESGLTPGYQVAQDVVAFIDELATNTSQLVYVVTDMPTVVADDVAAIALITQVAEGGTASAEGAAINADDNSRISPAGTYSNGATSVVAGSASSNPDTSAMETVFNDPAGAAPEDVATDLSQDVTGNGQHSDTGVFQVTSPVNLTKSMTVIDTLGGTDPHPGATIRYQIDVDVVGNSTIDNLLISDLIPADTTYTDDSILLNGVVQTDADDASTDFTHAIDILSKPVVSIEVDLSQGGAVSVTPGSTNTIIFEVTIN